MRGHTQVGESSLRGIYRFRAIGMFKRGKEWLITSSSRGRLPLTDWQRALTEVLLAHVR